MLGKKSTLKRLMVYLNEHSKDILWISQNSMMLGQTRRWFLAWSFYNLEKVPECRPTRKAYLTLKQSSTILPDLLQYCDNDLKIHCKKISAQKYHLLVNSNTWNRKTRRSKIAPTDAVPGVVESLVDVVVTTENEEILLITNKNILTESLFNHLSRKYPTSK